MAFAVLYLPLVVEFQRSRGEVAVVQSTVLLLGGFSGPLIGWAFDRWGPRLLFQAGALLAAAAFVAASRAESLATLALTYGVVGGLGLAALGGQGNMIVAALWYPRARGRAIAVVDLGTGFGAFCFIPLAQMLVESVGWRGTLLAWAAILIFVVVPLNALQRLPPSPAPVLAAGQSSLRAAWTLRDALGSSAFWWLATTRFFAAFAFPLLNVHMVAFAIGQGVSPAAAAAALGSVSLISLGGRLTTGWLCDRLGRAATATLMYGSAAVAIGCLSLLALTGAPHWLVLYVIFFGISQGSSGIVAAARAADVFAGASFGAIYGWLTLAVGPGEALGAWAGGLLFDLTGSYLGAFGLAVLALAAAVLAMWRVRPDPRRST